MAHHVIHKRLNFSVSPERRTAVYAEVIDISTPSASYYIRAAIATIIAAYGLLANSTAVVSGAMLIAPLMGPIFGMALGLSVGDRGLLRHATVSEAMGVLLVIAFAATIGFVPFNLDFGSEIMARTQMTTGDPHIEATEQSPATTAPATRAIRRRSFATVRVVSGEGRARVRL